MTAVQADEITERVESCWFWALKLANGFTRKFPHLADEIESESIYALFRAAQAFDPDRGPKLTTLVAVSVRRSVHSYIERERRRHPDRFQSVRHMDTEGEPIDPFRGLAARENPDSLELAELIAISQGAADPVDWELLIRIDRDNEKPSVIARELGVSRERVRQRRKRGATEARLAILARG
jgi:DNA-directed RNA polymerase specialized sigma24 family protein